MALQIAGQWLWMWLAALISLLLYSLLFLFIQGYITVEPKDPWWKFTIPTREQSKIDEPRPQVDDRQRHLSHAMIAYVELYVSHFS
jgi:hypothetical protein